MNATFTDTHLHLDFAQLSDELSDVLERARTAGVTRFITIGTTLERSRQCVELAAAHDDVWAAVGVHPSDANELAGEDGSLNQSAIAELAKLAHRPRVVAVGEAGFDLFHDTNPAEAVQQIAFTAQGKVAADRNLPVIIHSRDAERLSLPSLAAQADRAGERTPGVVHCFTGSLEFAKHVLELGYLIGFTAPVGYPKNDALREVVRQVPLEKIMLETDAPFLPPADKRGQRNEPAYLVETARIVAELKGVSLAELGEVTNANANRLFGLA